MSMRGVEKQNSFAVTSAMLGAFRDNAAHADGIPRADEGARADDELDGAAAGTGLRERLTCASSPW